MLNKECYLIHGFKLFLSSDTVLLHMAGIAENMLQSQYGTCENTSDSVQQEVAFDLAIGRCFWTGSWFQDYKFHVCNDHPLLSCCFCHKDHPYSKGERCAVLLVITALAIPPSAVLGVALREHQVHVSHTLAVFLFVTLPVMVLQYILAKLAVLDFYIRYFGWISSSVNCFSTCLQKLANSVQFFKNWCFFWALVFSAIILIASVEYLAHVQASFKLAVWPLIVSQLQSWVIWFALDLANPCYGFMMRWWVESWIESPVKVSCPPPTV